MDGIIRTIKGNSFEICRKEMERCKDTGSLKPENIDKKQVVKGVSKMKETKTTVKGMVKRGLVLCMVGVMAFGMVACGGNKDKKSTTTQPKTKTESSKSTGKKSTTKKQEDQKADDTKTDYDQEDQNDVTTPNQNDVTAPDQNKTDDGQNQGNAAAGQQDNKEDSEKGATTSKKSDKNKKSIRASRNNSTKDRKTN